MRVLPLPITLCPAIDAGVPGAGLNVGESLVGVAVIAVVVLFLRFLGEHRKETAKEQADERKVHRETLDAVLAHHDRQHGQVMTRMEQLAEQQRDTTDCLRSIATQLDQKRPQ